MIHITFLCNKEINVLPRLQQILYASLVLISGNVLYDITLAEAKVVGKDVLYRLNLPLSVMSAAHLFTRVQNVVHLMVLLFPRTPRELLPVVFGRVRC